jgi:hypothetical protein
MANNVQQHSLEILALIASLVITLVLSCWAGWC